METEELVFRYDGFVVRLKKDFVRLDTSLGIEADDYCLDFSNKKDIIKICELMKSSKPSFNSRKNQSAKQKVTILDNNPLSIASFMEDNPDVEL